MLLHQRFLENRQDSGTGGQGRIGKSPLAAYSFQYENNFFTCENRAIGPSFAFLDW
jgi:hypothetical protein